MLRKLPVAQTAAGAAVSERTVKRARAGQTVSKTARHKLTAYAIRHARNRLRAAGIPRPPDREALLATNLDRQQAPDPQPQVCACGCGQPVTGRKRYLDQTHKQAAYRQRKTA